MDRNNNDSYEKLRRELLDLAENVQNTNKNNETYKQEIQASVQELQKIYKEVYDMHKRTSDIAIGLDKDHAIQGEKNSNIFYQLEQLERRITDLEQQAQKSNDSSKQFVEKVIMLIIGAIVTWIFNILQGG